MKKFAFVLLTLVSFSSLAQAETLAEWKIKCVTPYFENYGSSQETSAVGFNEMDKCTKKLDPENSSDPALKEAFLRCSKMQTAMDKPLGGIEHRYEGTYAVYMCMYKVF